MPNLKRISLGCLLLVPFAQSAPNVTLELLEVDPQDGTVLPLNEGVYGRIAYQTDTPVRLVLHPYRNGEEVVEGVYYSGSPDHPAPSGEALAWFGFRSPQVIDEVRAIASGDWGEEFAHASLRRSISWRAGAQAPPVASWVEPLKERTDAVNQAQEGSSSDVGPVATVLENLAVMLVQLMFLLVPVSVVLQVIAWRTLEGTPQLLAKVSAVAMAMLWLFVIVTAMAGSNLSPIWLVFLSPIFVIFLAVLLVRHRRSRRMVH